MHLEYVITMQSFNAEILGFAFIIVLLHVFVVSYIHVAEVFNNQKGVLY